MPYKTEWRNRGVCWTYTGTVSGEDILKSNLDIYGDERFDDLKYQIVNLLEAEKIEVSERHMQKVAHLDAAAARTNKRVRVAVVAADKDARLLHELYVKHLSDGGWTSKLFDSIESAEAWVK
ncbi:hypothetical protein DDZ13_13755 [Coraliomargarita sinensis]|uniref:STAS/SEC14 domain-containing protein n=1 Tax=Coraliomargarita sinensis TaxID=2174842 RepID=A0A317ZGQ6_9BACT|nr:hypothetical protein [Coraliomargarita sinensis]PXA03128.1 hypothetical protein DDZ13_13755 [Coraliomargarita sinensis]